MFGCFQKQKELRWQKLIIKYQRFNIDNLYFKMSSSKVQNLLNGISCAITTNDIMQLESVCTRQSYSLQKLIQIAKTIFQSDPQHCFKFLQYVEKTQIHRNRNKDFQLQPLKMQIFYCLAALALTKGLKQNDKAQSQKWQKQFNRYLNLGSNVKTSAEKMYQLLHGFNSYYAADFSKAMSNFNRLQNPDKKQGGLSTVALLGLAQSHFMLRKYDKALQYYKKALISNKNLPTKARLGMGYCFFELQKYQLAQKCFQRIISLDPNSAESYLAIAVIKHRSGNLKQYFINLKKAYSLKPNDPLINLHLSQHFLISGDFEKCEKMSIRGLQLLQSMPKFLKSTGVHHRDDYEILKARFNNLIGQVHHSRSQFEQARKYYELAKQKKLKFNQISLAQVIAHTTQPNSYKEALRILQPLFYNGKPTELKIISEFYKTIAYLQIKCQSKGNSEQTSPHHYYKQALKYNKNDYEVLVEYSVFLSDSNDKKHTLKTLLNALKAVETTGKEPKVELLNNIAVSLIQERQVQQAGKYLQRALKTLEGSVKSNMQDEARYHSLVLTIKFNKAIFLQLKHKYEDCIKTHQELVQFNKYFIDSYVKLADILHHLGRKKQAYSVLNQAISQCSNYKNQQIRIDKLYTMRGHLQHKDGHYGQARESFKKLGKSTMPYDQLYDLCLGYELIMKRQPDKMLLKDFLRPNRQLCITLCENDHHNVFAYMMLTVLFLIDNKITKQQGIQYFNQLKIAEQQFPEIQYNYGVFSLLSEDYENALFCFNRFKQKTKSNKADEYISLAYFLKGDYSQCLSTIKKNIINQPNNLKFRFQYAYANEKRVQKLYEQQKNFKDIRLSTRYLMMCKKIYESLSKLGSIQYIKTIENPELKQRVKNQITKLRVECQNRDMYVQSQLGYYGNKEKQISQKQRRIKQQEARKLQQLKKAKESQMLLEQLGEDEDESDSEKKRKQRRRQLMQLSLRQSQQANEQWKIFKQKQQEKAELGQQLKKKRKNNQGKRQRKKKDQNIQQKMQQNQYVSQQSFKDENQSQEQPLLSGEQSINKKKKKKKKNKDRDRSGSQDDKKKRKKRKKEMKQRGSDEDIRDEDDISKKDDNESQKGSNPFDDNLQNLQDEIEEQQPRKQKKKKKKDQDDEIDLNDYIIE